MGMQADDDFGDFKPVDHAEIEMFLGKVMYWFLPRLRKIFDTFSLMAVFIGSLYIAGAVFVPPYATGASPFGFVDENGLLPFAVINEKLFKAGEFWLVLGFIMQLTAYWYGEVCSLIWSILKLISPKSTAYIARRIEQTKATLR